VVSDADTPVSLAANREPWGTYSRAKRTATMPLTPKIACLIRCTQPMYQLYALQSECHPPLVPRTFWKLARRVRVGLGALWRCLRAIEHPIGLLGKCDFALLRDFLRSPGTAWSAQFISSGAVRTIPGARVRRWRGDHGGQCRYGVCTASWL